MRWWLMARFAPKLGVPFVDVSIVQELLRWVTAKTEINPEQKSLFIDLEQVSSKRVYRSSLVVEVRVGSQNQHIGKVKSERNKNTIISSRLHTTERAGHGRR